MNTKYLIITLLMTFVSLVMLSFATSKTSTKYKCMIQLKNYTGEGAYVIISLLNPEGKYERTLYVQGEDEEWYDDVPQWWEFHNQKQEDIDGITGATIRGGERTIKVIEIEDDKIDTGYKIRFETAVEDQEYYEDDVEFELTKESVRAKAEGKGFIRYVRMMPQ